MSLAPGVRLGPYQIVALLGAGGMGEVYRASDTRLGREVALKLLPQEFASDPDRLARFDREAKLLASLLHPNVATLFGLEEAHGRRMLAMELVAGVDLAERLKRGPIPAEEAVAIARQIAEALEEAHEHGIVHRDLKPANVKLASDGKVKVLDFGLAKAWSDDDAAVSGSPALTQSPTLAHTGTGAGIILGTAAYMSPEQARAKPVDKRADVWAFGVVLFEMLTGRRLFDGETVTDVLAAVVTREPDLASLPAATPAGVRQLLERCLRKDPRKRLRDVGEARIALEEAAAGFEAPGLGGARAGAPTRRSSAWQRGLAWAVTALALALAGTAYWRPPLATPAPLLKLKLQIGELRTGIVSPPELSPDGRRIVYVAAEDLWLRELSELEPRKLVSSATPSYPMWSPDSAQVAYIAGQKLWRVAATGGVPVLIADASFARGGFSPGGVWLPDDTIVFAPAANGTGLIAVPARGGAFVPFHAAGPDESDFHKPSQLPGGRGILLVVDPNVGASDRIDLLASGTRKTVFRDPGQEINSPVYSPTGHLVYVRSGRDLSAGNNSIWAVPFSLERLETSGTAFPVAQQARWPSVGLDGTLVYTEPVNPKLELVWLGADGAPPKAIGPASHYLRWPSLSLDGTRVAAVGPEGMFVRELRKDGDTRLTFDEQVYRDIAWHPDGRSLVYRASQGGKPVEVVMKPADGSGEPKTLFLGEAPSVSRDGKWLLFQTSKSGVAGDLFYAPLDGSASPQPFLEGPDYDTTTAFSADGRFVAIATQAPSSDRYEIVIRRFPRGDGVWQVSNNGGEQPRWNGRGDRLYYRQGRDLMEVDVALRTTPQLGARRLRIAGGPSRIVLEFGYDVALDGSGFVAIRELPDAGGATPSLTFVQSWFEEFRTAAGKR